METNSTPIGILGGTGLDAFPELEILEHVACVTPYGRPSEDLVVARLGGQNVVFVPRHGADHRHPPHLVPYKANLAAMKQLGVRTVVATCIVGSLKASIEPGSFVVPDQFVHFTSGRDAQSVEADGSFVHLSMADPFCGALRSELIGALRETDVTTHEGGTTVVIQGPRFTTRAESRFFIRNEWDIVNMTQYPECVFARELGLCYATMASVTDWDVGVGTTISMRPENMDRVLEIFRANTVLTKRALVCLVRRLSEFQCGCASTVIEEYYKRR